MEVKSLTNQDKQLISVRKTILLVDDDPNLMLILKEHTEFALKVNVLIAENGYKALEILEEKIPDLIISDVMMPHMDGYSLVQHVRQDPRTSLIPIIFLSALGQSKDRVKGLNTGADAYIVKPFEPEELFAQIESFLLPPHSKARILQKMTSHNSALIELTQTLETALEAIEKENCELKKEVAKRSSKSEKGTKASIIHENISKYQAICGSIAHSLRGEFGII